MLNGGTQAKALAQLILQNPKGLSGAIDESYQFQIFGADRSRLQSQPKLRARFQNFEP